MPNQAQLLINTRLRDLAMEIRTGKEFLLGDNYWTVRYLVADTGEWITDRHQYKGTGVLGKGF